MGGSALFGANAVGGVINVITREPLRNTASLRQSYTSFQKQGGYTSMMPTTSFNGSLVTEDRRAAAMIFGQHSSRGMVDTDGDDFTDIPELKNRALGVSCLRIRRGSTAADGRISPPCMSIAVVGIASVKLPSSSYR